MTRPPDKGNRPTFARARPLPVDVEGTLVEKNANSFLIDVDMVDRRVVPARRMFVGRRGLTPPKCAALDHTEDGARVQVTLPRWIAVDRGLVAP